MKCKICSSEIYPGDKRCRRCKTTILETQKDSSEPEPSFVEETTKSAPLVQWADKSTEDGDIQIPSLGSLEKLLNRSGDDKEVFEAYRKHIESKLSSLDPEDERVIKCRVVFERMHSHRNEGNMSKALRFATTCLLMLEEIAPTKHKAGPVKKIPPELKKITEDIKILQSKALETGVNILKSEKLRIAALNAFIQGSKEEGTHLFHRCLDTIESEIRIYILQLLSGYTNDVEKAKQKNINTSEIEGKIMEMRLMIANKDYISVLNLVPIFNKEIEDMKNEFYKKTNTFECPVCGMVNSIENHECEICGTLFPELGPIYKGEKVRVIPPLRKIK